MKKAIKSVIAVALASTMAATALAGCGAGSSSGSAASAGGSGEKVTLNLGYWDNERQGDTMRKLVAAYTKENPNVTINLQYTPYKGGEYWTKLDASMNGGTAPDVFWMNCLHAKKYVNGNMLEPLDDALKAANIDVTKDFPTALSQIYTFNSKVYAVPKDFDTNAVWYNKEIFDAAKVPYPKDGWTWEDMVATAKKLTNSSKGIYGIASPLDFQTCYWNTIFANGGSIVSSDSKSTLYSDAKTMGGIQPWIDLILKDKVSPDINTLTDNSADSLFESGKLAMCYGASYMIAEYLSSDTIKGKVNLVSLPTLNGSKGNVINGLGYAVYSKSKQKEAAKKLAAWLGSAEAQKIQGEVGAVISARNDAQQYFTKTQPSLNLQVYIDAVADSKPLPTLTVSSELFDNESKYLKQAWAGTMTLKDACAKLDADNKTLLEKEK
ncbi:MAG: sugar ABC transporter substrate-binding protein [Oscillospiraceae bacterium]|jgi:multiple sugar transport system substrate-binding protein|nr:sugar ABC transporter substrate-binding protein [Oscillospiraceae bacterium]MDD3262110.1 sugar ABC transporter substrate-binding protein [Oscillospiraceae bacterium]